MWTTGWRDDLWHQLAYPWDLIVIGGGISGAGILREAARLELRVLLLDQGDFASGTSSRSSKLVHGGLRYLKNGQIKTTLSSVHERQRLLHQGRGLVTPLGFLYAGYQGDAVPLPIFGLGLAIYDILGLRWGHKRYDPAALVRLAPYLSEKGLLGGYRYFDAQTDDARLVLRLIREAVSSGAHALNYAQVTSLLRTRDGQVRGVVLQDDAPGGRRRTMEVQAAVVINATGAAADRLRGEIGRMSRLRQLRGSHLVFPAQRLPVSRAISFAHPVDRRPVFALPWEGVTLFGTTDVDHHQPAGQEPAISGAEVDYLLSALAFAFPDLDLSETDVQSTFSGVRAVVDTGKADPSKESREHVLWDEYGLLTVTGGKLTTFRVMAHDALRAVRGRLPGRPQIRRQCVLDPLDEIVAGTADLPAAQLQRLLGRYGADTADLLAAAGPDDLVVVDGSPTLWAELCWAARAEAVVHLDDLLLRRVRLGNLLPQGGLPLLPRIRSLVQPSLGWDDARWQAEVERYTRLWQTAYSLPEQEAVDSYAAIETVSI